MPALRPRSNNDSSRVAKPPGRRGGGGAGTRTRKNKDQQPSQDNENEEDNNSGPIGNDDTIGHHTTGNGQPMADRTNASNELLARLESMEKQLAAERQARIDAERRAGSAAAESTQNQAPSQPPSTPTPTSTANTNAPVQEYRVIPRPPGEAGNPSRGFGIIDGMQVDEEGAPTMEQYECVRRNLAEYITVVGLDIALDWRHQDSEKIHKLCAKVIKEHPYMRCYANHWATKEMAKIIIRNKRSYRIKQGYMPKPVRKASTSGTGNSASGSRPRSRAPAASASASRRNLRNVDEDDDNGEEDGGAGSSNQ